MPEQIKAAYKNTWDNPYTGRVWHECGACRGKVSAKATVCRHCGAAFLNAKKEADESEAKK